MEIDAPASMTTRAPRSEPVPRSRAERTREEAVLALLDRRAHEEALKILMSTYGAPIVSFALRILRDRELAEDVRQQVFIDAYQKLDTFERRSSLWSWLCGITYHRCLDELRRKQRAAAQRSDVDVSDEHLGASQFPMDADRVAQHRALQRCLGKLPAAMRAQLLMRCFLGLSYEEIGAEVGEPPGTVQVRISRILPRLRQCLRNEGVWR